MSTRASNMRALCELLALDSASATRALDSVALLTATAEPRALDMVSLILGRTLTTTTEGSPSSPAVELVFGDASPRSRAPTLFVEADADGVRIGSRRRLGTLAPMHPIFSLLAACYASGLAIQRIIHPEDAAPDVHIRWDDYLALDRRFVPVRFGQAFVAGAGAVGCGFLLAANELPLEGQLIIADHDDVDESNPHRQVLYTHDHVGQAKAEVAAGWVNGRSGSLRARAERCRLQEVADRTADAWLRHLVVGVDSRRARRMLASELPLHVYDASTTGADDVVLNFATATNDSACLACAYPEDATERAHELHLAEALGVDPVLVRQQLIDRAAAEQIAARHPGFGVNDVEGLAFDTVFRQLCGAGRLHASTDSSRAVVAPLAYVPVLAGTLLALEFYRRVGRASVTEPFGSWHVHPLRSPVPELRRIHAARSGCACRQPTFARTVMEVWQR